jgi:hypothetical protein
MATAENQSVQLKVLAGFTVSGPSTTNPVGSAAPPCAPAVL